MILHPQSKFLYIMKNVLNGVDDVSLLVNRKGYTSIFLTGNFEIIIDS